MILYRISQLSDEASDRLSSRGYEVINTVDIQGYNLFLIKVPNLDNFYQIALQREGLDFTDMASHNEHLPPKEQFSKVKLLLEGLKSTIDVWLSRYNKLYVVSNNESQQTQYVRILTRLGYNLSEDVIFGKRVSYIS